MSKLELLSLKTFHYVDVRVRFDDIDDYTYYNVKFKLKNDHIVGIRSIIDNHGKRVGEIKLYNKIGRKSRTFYNKYKNQIVNNSYKSDEYVHYVHPESHLKGK